MQGEPLTQARLDALWASLHEAVADCAWEAAEGLLRRFLQLVPDSPLEVWDTLAYVLLMQGDYSACLSVLEPRRGDPARSFWLEHKLGDAHRGLNQLQAAVECYRRSLEDGSDSPLTCRNLLQVLDGLDPALAVLEVQAWQDTNQVPSAGAWEGARQAAALVPGLALAQKLWQAGEVDAACRRRLLEEACYRLEHERVLALLSAAQTSADGLSAWELALQRRLQLLNLGAATSGPDADAPPHSAARC